MSHREQAPIESPGNMGTDSKRYDHPAFGQIAASRVQGDSTLYGSDFLHHAYITITIRRSQLCRDLSRDWHFGGEELIDVALSEAQWATFVSSLNVGQGVPCTIQHHDRKPIPTIPLRRNEDVVQDELAATVKQVAMDLDAAITDIEGIIGESVSAKKREAILVRLRAAHRQVDDHLPFAAESFERHMEKTVEKAKVEVNAYAEHLIVRAGLTALGVPSSPLQLGPSSQPETP